MKKQSPSKFKFSLLLILFSLLFNINCSKDKYEISSLEIESDLNINHPFLNWDFSKNISTSSLQRVGCTNISYSSSTINLAIEYLNSYETNYPGSLTTFQNNYGYPLWQYSIFIVNELDSVSMLTPMVNLTRDSIIGSLISYIKGETVTSIHLINIKELNEEKINPIFLTIS